MTPSIHGFQRCWRTARRGQEASRFASGRHRACSPLRKATPPIHALHEGCTSAPKASRLHRRLESNPWKPVSGIVGRGTPSARPRRIDKCRWHSHRWRRIVGRCDCCPARHSPSQRLRLQQEVLPSSGMSTCSHQGILEGIIHRLSLPERGSHLPTTTRLVRRHRA